MKIAIASDDNKLLFPFWTTVQIFLFYEIDNNRVTFIEKLTPPPHKPGVIPNWLIKQNIDFVLTGGMGPKAKAILNQKE